MAFKGLRVACVKASAFQDASRPATHLPDRPLKPRALAEVGFVTGHTIHVLIVFLLVFFNSEKTLELAYHILLAFLLVFFNS